MEVCLIIAAETVGGRRRRGVEAGAARSPCESRGTFPVGIYGLFIFYFRLGGEAAAVSADATFCGTLSLHGTGPIVLRQLADGPRSVPSRAKCIINERGGFTSSPPERVPDSL
ncbi:hypothetical protein GWI33_005511 [Rhynchophorus ferrugineus]|uniref:Uncharacterized protein n=1 Tax=Rhynchophorus ferrugineus TaxID=354439 RepID=A0A834MHX9_RHYFE|nr:hypothetical protein GWI33_005511 [Rhynchophorus ferrugineus]